MKIRFMNYLIKFMLLLALSMIILPLFFSGNYQKNIFEIQSTTFSGWKTITDGGNIESFTTFPISIKSGAGETTTIFNNLPKKIAEDTCLLLRTDNQVVHVWIDGELVYSYGENKLAPYLSSSSGNWNIVRLNQKMAGSQISIAVKSPYKAYSGRFTTIYLASHYEAVLIILLKGFWNIILAVILLLSGIYFFLNSIYFEKKEILSPYRSISIFCLCIAAWVITQGHELILLIPNPLFIYFFTNITYMLSPVFFLIFLRWKEPEFETPICILTTLVSVNVIVCIFIQLLTYIDLWQLLITTNLFMFLCGALFLYINLKKKRYRDFSCRGVLIVAASVIMIAGITADIIKFYMHKFENYGVVTAVVVCIFLICMGIDMIQTTKLLTESSHLLQKELEQAEVSLLSTQIKPHFIYNCLATISYLCKTDAEKADAAVLHLSGYLRHNINHTNDNQLIEFMEEIKHVRNYMFLEKTRFPQIEFQQELYYKDFQIPPLVIQPFIENAVKHGISKKMSGGTIRLKTYLERSTIIIEIADNGVGFDLDKVDLSCSTGIANATKRLKLLLDASVEIKSEVDKGTIVVIKIDKI